MEVALYYPNIVPPLDWMKQSLLFFDSISSVAPMDHALRDDLIKGSAEPEVAEAWRWLENGGYWTPAIARDLTESNLGIPNLEDALEVLATAEIDRSDKIWVVPARGRAPLDRTLNLSFRERLLAGGAARVDGGYLLMPNHFRIAIQAIISLHAAQHPETCLGFDQTTRRVTPSTDDEVWFRMATKASLGDGSGMPKRSDCYQILLDGLLPVPGPAVSLPDIIAFKNNYRDELLSFRSAVNEMLAQVLEAPSPRDAIMDHRNNIELARIQINKAARSRRLSLTGAAATIATGIAVTDHFGGYEAVKWIFDGIGVAIGLAIGSQARRAENQFKYLIRSYEFEG
jgi:hypothetical protein